MEDIKLLKVTETLQPEMKRDINDHPLQAEGTAVVKQGSLDQPGGLVVQQTMPPTSGDEFREDNCSQLAVVVLAISLVDEFKQGADDRPIGRWDNHQWDIRPPLRPFFAHLFPSARFQLHVHGGHVIRD